MRTLLLAATALVTLAAATGPVLARQAAVPQLPPGMIPVGPGAAEPAAPAVTATPAAPAVPAAPQVAAPQAVAGGSSTQTVPSPFGPSPSAAAPAYVPVAAPAPYYPPQAAPAYGQPAPGYGPQPGYPAPQGYPQPAPGYGPAPQTGYPYPAPPAGYAPPPADPTPADLAFQKAIMSTLPLNEEQARDYRSRAAGVQRIIASPASGERARPRSSSASLSLHAGEGAPLLGLAPGNATVLTFYDQTGASWPVMSVTVGNPTAYSAQEAGEKGKTNMVVISPLSNYGSGNLVVTLVGHPVPVLFSLETGGSTVDYRKDIQIEGRGPNAQYDIGETSSLAPTNDPTMQSFVDGMAPKGAHKIHTSSAEVEAWRYEDMVYVRTSLQMLSPAWIAHTRHVSGINVYTIADAPILMFSTDGRTTLVTLDR